MLGLVVEIADDLLGEVVIELAMGAGHALDERPDLPGGPITEGGIDHLERRRPAFGPVRQVGQDVGFERPLVGVPEEALGLAEVEPQVRGRQLRDLAEGSQAGEGQIGLLPADEHEAQSFRGPVTSLG